MASLPNAGATVAEVFGAGGLAEGTGVGTGAGAGTGTGIATGAGAEIVFFSLIAAGFDVNGFLLTTGAGLALAWSGRLVVDKDWAVAATFDFARAFGTGSSRPVGAEP